jgi:CheY-like chemotaxis protein
MNNSALVALKDEQRKSPMSRPLSGSLNDVDLDEVVRVIARSRRSGLLDVSHSDARAELCFISGRLVRVRLDDSAETMGAMVVRLGLLASEDVSDDVNDTSETIEALVSRVEAKRAQKQLLVRVDDAIAEALEDAVARVLGWRTGSFSFRVTGDTAVPLRYVGDTAMTVPSGVDAEGLARDVCRRQLENQGAPFGVVATNRGSKTPQPAGRTELIVVDDDPAFLGALEELLAEAGVPCLAAASAERAINRIARAAQDGIAAIIVDLVMPRSTGRGLLGGLELLTTATEAGVGSRVFLAIDEPHADAEALAKSMGAVVLHKPKRREDLPGFLNPVLALLQRPAISTGGFDLARELSRELPATDALRSEWHVDARGNPDESLKSLETLKALLVELNNPSFEEEIPLLLLRFASAFFVRGALFSVDHARQELVGLGGFGVGGSDPGRLVRSIRVPLQADTVFARAIANRCGVRQHVWESEWNTRLFSMLAGPRPRETYTAPLISPRGLEGVLYADNGTAARPFPDIALLEIFLQQASAALERATMARELDVLRASQLPTPAASDDP